MISVLIADDHTLVRTGFRMILQNAPDVQVIGEAGDGAEAAAMTLALQPDVVLMDIRMPDVDGVEATRRIHSADQGDQRPRVLILTTFDLDEYVVAALRAGASGFLLKDILAADLLAAIRQAARGDAVVAPAVTRRLIEHYVGTRPHHAGARLDALTAREREVLAHVARGLSNGEIAASLYLTEGTVKTHVSRILAKLGLRDRVQAVVYAYETGLIRANPGPPVP